jgi:hypothetical protein
MFGREVRVRVNPCGGGYLGVGRTRENALAEQLARAEILLTNGELRSVAAELCILAAQVVDDARKIQTTLKAAATWRHAHGPDGSKHR